MLGALALVLVFAAVYAALAALLHQLGEGRRSVVLGFTTLVLGALPAQLARLTQDLGLAALLLALLAAALLAVLWRRSPRHPLISWPAEPLPRWALLAAALLLYLVAHAAYKNYLWDEYNGHFPLTSVLARGVSPPEHPLFPGQPFRYHWAFDALAALFVRFLDLRVEHAIDCATVWCFAVLLAAAAAAGRVLAQRTGGWLGLLLAPLGAGTLLYLLLPELGPLELRWSLLPPGWLDSVPPHVMSNFFQHPQGFAMGPSLALLLYSAAPAPGARSWGGRILGGVMLGLLSLGQLVFFLLLGLALGVLALVRGHREKRTRGFGPAAAGTAADLAALALALVVAFALGGFFEDWSQRPRASLLLFGRSLFGEPPLVSLAHHLVVFGLPLLVLPLAFRWLRRPGWELRLALLAGACAGFLVPNVVVYARSWDVVKFYGVGGFFANLLLAEQLAALIQRPGRGPRALAVAGLVAACFVGALWVFRMGWLDGRYGVPKMHFPPPPPIAHAVREQVGERIAPYERVLSSHADLAMGAGFLIADWERRYFHEGWAMSIPGDLAAAAARAMRELGRRDLELVGARWLILSRGELGNLSPAGRAALADPSRFEHVLDVEHAGDFRAVYRVLP